MNQAQSSWPIRKYLPYWKPQTVLTGALLCMSAYSIQPGPHGIHCCTENEVDSTDRFSRWYSVATKDVLGIVTPCLRNTREPVTFAGNSELAGTSWPVRAVPTDWVMQITSGEHSHMSGHGLKAGLIGYAGMDIMPSPGCIWRNSWFGLRPSPVNKLGIFSAEKTQSKFWIFTSIILPGVNKRPEADFASVDLLAASPAWGR